MIRRIEPGKADRRIAMAIAERIELREIEIFICGLCVAREPKGGSAVTHLSKLTVCGARALNKLRWVDVRVPDHLSGNIRRQDPEPVLVVQHV